jgi:hypothetical protein
MEEIVAKKDWFRIFSPAVLGIAFAVVGIIISYADMEKSGGWSYLGVIILTPISILLLALDFIVKAVFKDKTIFIWLVELGILGLIYAFWISKFI